MLFKVNVKCDLLLWKNHFLHARCHTPFSLTPVSGMLCECSCQPPTSSNIENWLGVADRWHHITHRTWCYLCKKNSLTPTVMNISNDAKRAKKMLLALDWSCNIINFDLIGLLPTNHIIAYIITMAYLSLWGNVRC